MKGFRSWKSENNSGYGVNTSVGNNLKQAMVSSVQQTNNTYVKYPELYPSSDYSKYNEGGYSSIYPKYPDSLYPGQYDPDDYLHLFPVDTPNTIPTSAADFKQLHEDTLLSEPVPNNAVAAVQQAACSEGQIFDINALLAFPESNGGVEDTFVGDFSWQLLEGLEHAHMKDADLVQQLEGNLPDEIYSLPGLEKDASYQVYMKESDGSCEMLSPVTEQHSPYQQLPTPMDHSDSTSSLSPESSPPSSQPTPIAMVPMLEEIQGEAAGSGVLWRHDLQNLFEKTFDLNELANDFMIVPPSEEKPPISQSPPPEVDKKPVLLDPPLKDAFEAPPKTFHTKEDMKPKPTLLFGKHEGEIIHKLLARKKGTRSKPVTRDKLISMAVEEFNSLLEQAHLTEIEVAFMKEWRRRGKNKAAAQIARKRKREEVTGLDQEVQNMRQQKAQLEKRCRQLQSQVSSFKERAKLAEEKIYHKQSALTGKAVNRKTHHILTTEDEQLLLVPRAASK